MVALTTRVSKLITRSRLKVVIRRTRKRNLAKRRSRWMLATDTLNPWLKMRGTKTKRRRKRKRRTRKRSEALRVMIAQQIKRSLPHRAEKINLRLRISRSILQERTRHKKIMKLTSISSRSSSTNRSSRMKRKMKMKLTIPMTLMTTLKTSKTKRMMKMMRRMAVTRKTRCSSMWMS